MPPAPDGAGPRLRPYRPADAGPLALLFHRAVHDGTAPHYTDEERRAWSPEPPPPDLWARRLGGLVTLVAEAGGEPVGFMSLRAEDGYLDFAFVAPEWRGTGLAARLLHAIEGAARQRGLRRLHVQASHLARPFLARHGWRFVSTGQVMRAGVALTNHRMERDLPPVD